MSKVRLTGSNSGYVEIAAVADAGNLSFTMPTHGTALLGNGNNVYTGITTFNGATIFNDDVTFDGATAGYDVVWDRSDNQLEFADHAKISMGSGGDLLLYHDGNHSYIDDAGQGNLRLRSGTLEIQNLAGNKTSAVFSSGSGQTLNFNNNTKFVTTNTGVVVTGICTATSFSGSGEGLTRTSQFSHRNILINGSCAVSQRGTSFSGTGFTLDRYYVGSGDYSVAQIADAPSNSGLTYSLRISRTASTTGYLTFQMIELPATGQAGQFYNGAKFTLSGYVKGTSGATITPTLRFSTGTNGSNGSSFTRTEGAFTCNGSWQPFTFHFTVDENVGGSDKCVQSYFTFVTTATGQNVFFTGLQLESGEVATPFEHRSFEDELARCQRYYEIVSPTGGMACWSWSTSSGGTNVFWKVRKRTTPSCGFNGTLTNQANGSNGQIGVYSHNRGWNTWGTLAMQEPMRDSVRISFGGMQGWNAGDAIGIYFYGENSNITGEAEL